MVLEYVAQHPEAALMVIGGLGTLQSVLLGIVWRLGVYIGRADERFKTCEKDIDGVASVVGTKRAMARLSGEIK